ncbi:helix-turn-helix transcriptional regulator [Paenibacillus chitinolyticus]|uniref:helix-turn-helix transcriptional regulator n=1 Tax=Paenibacillus chitinolyticus TaxID=79263 RepID=UPI002DB7784F|nr:helix-turn-helix transcriptional regulator [Paenibacillus chitinolyticus]MEC0248876.1 helix-turn-helix transcriptional regulator [Paenibacillus chitinolyticus]
MNDVVLNNKVRSAIRQSFRSAREAKGTRAEVAKRLKMKEITLRHHELGINDPPLIKCFEYSLYFGLSIQELFTDVLEQALKNFST